MGIRLLVAILLVSACAPGASGGTGTDAPLRILAAASLRDAVRVAAQRFEAGLPGVAVRASFASSTTLRVQIEQGAPGDVFLSADVDNVEVLVGSGLATGPTTVFTSNALVIVVPRDNPAGIVSPVDLGRPGVKLIGAGEGVPIAGYARRLVADLSRVPGYPPGFAAAVAENVVSREDDVRAVLAKIELGEGDAGIVYVTDAASSSAVRTIALPSQVRVRALYGGAVLTGSDRPDLAADFLAWLAGPEGQAVLAGFGFEAVS